VTQKDAGLKLVLFAGLGLPGPPNHARAGPVTLQNFQNLRLGFLLPPPVRLKYESHREEVPSFNMVF
jgi:hypothetical protein